MSWYIVIPSDGSEPRIEALWVDTARQMSNVIPAAYRSRHLAEEALKEYLIKHPHTETKREAS